MDTSWYLDLNHFARTTSWLHGFMRAYALWGGVLILGLLVVAGWWVSRRGGPEAAARAAWAGLGTLVAVGLNQPLGHLVGRVRPYDVLHHVEVLVPRTHDFTFPSDHATVAGAVIAGLLLAGRRRLALAAAVAGLLLAFARVYVGAHYPGDVAGGLVFGALIVTVLMPVALWILDPVARLAVKSPLRFFVSTGPGALEAAARPRAAHRRGTPPTGDPPRAGPPPPGVARDPLGGPSHP